MLQWCAIGLLTLSFMACTQSERSLRGRYSISSSGETYLSLKASNSCSLALDGKPWAGTLHRAFTRSIALGQPRRWALSPIVRKRSGSVLFLC
jgi:hypothetical protein